MVGSSQVTDKYPAIRRKKKPGQRSTYNKHPQSKPTQKGNVIITKTGHSIMYRGFITKSCRYWCAVYCVGWWRQVPTRAASCLLKQRISGRGGGEIWPGWAESWAESRRGGQSSPFPLL
jgi:hypothetical protein